MQFVPITAVEIERSFSRDVSVRDHIVDHLQLRKF